MNKMIKIDSHTKIIPSKQIFNTTLGTQEDWTSISPEDKKIDSPEENKIDIPKNNDEKLPEHYSNLIFFSI